MTVLIKRLAVFAALGMAALLSASGAQTDQTTAGSCTPPTSENLESIRDCLAGNRVAAALEAADRFAREHNEDPKGLFQLASLLASHSQDARAAAVFARVNELHPHSPDVLYNLGVAYYRVKQMDQAERALAESADLAGQPPETHFALALIAVERDDHENAILELQHAVQRAPRRADYYSLLGQEYSKVGYWQGAAVAFRRAAEIEPDDAMHFLRLGDALLRLKDQEGALHAYQQARRLDPDLPHINYLIGFAYQINGQFAKAGEFYEQELAIDPTHLESLVGASVAAVEQNHYADAEKFIELALAHDPDNVQANFELGLLRFRTQRYDRAIEVFKRVLWLRPDYTQAEYYLYLALARTHQAVAATTALAQWKKLEALDRKVRSQEVAYEMARAAHWQNEAASAN